MAIGCILTLIAFALGTVAGFRLIDRTEIADQLWLPFVYGGLSMLTYMNLWGILLAWRQKRAFNLKRSQWKDGSMVGITGKIRASQKPMIAPFSKLETVMVEYAIMLESSTDSPSDSRLCFGIMRTPCAIEFEGQSYRLDGLPSLTELEPKELLPQAAFPAASAFVRNTKYQALEIDPRKMAREVYGAYSDKDGDVQTHFAMPDYKAMFLDKLEAQTGDNLQGLDPFRGFRLEERSVPHDTEVSINGTFIASQNAIDIGGGLTKTSHALKLGPGSRPSNGPIIKSLIYGIVFTATLAAATYFLAKLPRL